MSKKKQKYYVVWNGHNPGIYTSWSACQKQINGFAGAKYKSFENPAEAEIAFSESSDKYIGQNKKPRRISPKLSGHDIIWESISVDAACSGKSGLMEYRGVWSGDRAEIFHQGPFEMGTNNVGEFLALVHGLAYLKKNNIEQIPIYSDSKTALSWLRKKEVKTTLKKTAKNKVLFDLIERALLWLRSNTYTTTVIKWDTAHWGEIPADFGRK